MKIQFLRDGSKDCPLIRLFDYQPGEVDQLRKACRDLADGRIAEFRIHDQPWAESVAGCRLILRTTPKDLGVEISSGIDAFVLALSAETWREVQGKLLPFADNSTGFTWLTDVMDGEIRVLTSQDGTW